MDSTTKVQFTREFRNKEVSLIYVLDSLFRIYEETGFFNVKFDVNVDTIVGDTVNLRIKILNRRLPVVNSVRVEGIRLPYITLQTYFPFRRKVFKRSTLISSFVILRNIGIISDAEYRFVPLNAKNMYALKLILQPYNEVFSINLTGNSQNGIFGTVTLAYPSILGTGVGLNTYVDFKDGHLSSYGIQGSFLLPWYKGLVLGGDATDISDSSGITERSISISWWQVNNGIRFKIGKIQASIYKSIEAMYYGNKWKGEVGVRRASGWIFSNFIAFESKLQVGAEQGIVFSSESHYFMINKSMRTSGEFLPSGKLHSFFLIRSRLPFTGNIFIFFDIGQLDDMSFLDTGLAYIKRHYGIYLGFSGDKYSEKVNISFVLGIKNSLFERSIRIL